MGQKIIINNLACRRWPKWVSYVKHILARWAEDATGEEAIGHRHCLMTYASWLCKRDPSLCCMAETNASSCMQ